jgi:hypothetical protein
VDHEQPPAEQAPSAAPSELTPDQRSAVLARLDAFWAEWRREMARREGREIA